VLAQPTTSTATQSSSVPQDVQMLKALLDEMRELRRTIEKNSLRQLHAQILLKGIEKQQDRIANMSQELDPLETSELAELIDRWRDRIVVRTTIPFLELHATNDDLALSAHPAKISASGRARVKR